MSEFKDQYDNVIQFPIKAVPKFGFERARVGKSEKTDQMERQGQMSLFRQPAADVVQLPTSAFAEAFLLDERGDARAAESYRKAIAEGDCVADAWCNLGIMQSRDGKRNEAFDSFTKALGHDPRHFESHYNLGNLYFESDDLRLARVHYEFAAAIKPTFPYLHFNLGLLYALAEDYEAAVDSLLRYKELAPEDESRQAEDLITNIRLTIARRH